MYERIVLPNGARIVCEHMDGVRSASLGIWVGAGSRYERYSEAGSAHFIEHMLFKGTSRWSAAELAERMDAVGGQMNACPWPRIRSAPCSSTPASTSGTWKTKRA